MIPDLLCAARWWSDGLGQREYTEMRSEGHRENERIRTREEERGLKEARLPDLGQ